MKPKEIGVSHASLAEKYLAGFSLKRIGDEVGLHEHSVRKRLLEAGVQMRAKGEPTDMVSNELLREYFLEHNIDAKKVCAALGWQTHGYADTSRLRKNLGLTKRSKGGPPSFIKKIHYNRAVEICRAMGADPYRVGV